MYSCDATCISAKIFNHEKEKTYDFKSIFREKNQLNSVAFNNEVYTVYF